MYALGYVITPGCLLSSRRVEEVNEIYKEESSIENFYEKSCRDGDYRLARRSSSVHRTRAGNEEALHRTRYRHQQCLPATNRVARSEEHTSELQSHSSISYP